MSATDDSSLLPAVAMRDPLDGLDTPLPPGPFAPHQVLASGLGFPEGPVALPDGSILLVEIEQARSAVINAAAAIDAERVIRERALSAAKVTIGRVGPLVAEECIQLHGGIGMTWELPLPHYAKRLVMIDHQLGDEDHHLARYIELGRQAVA